MLFTTLPEIKKYLPASLTFNVADLKPYITRAENRFIIPVLSKAQFDNLQAAYDASIASVPVDLSTSNAALLDKVRAALANFAFMLYVPFGQVTFDASGIRVSVTQDNKPANKDQIAQLIQSFSDGGYEGIDTLLDFLEANKATYTLWAGSTSYTEFKELFINTTAQFNDLVFINQSMGNARRTFISFRSIMKKVEDFFVMPILAGDLFDEIKAQIKANTLTAANTKLLSFIRPAVANLTVAKAIATNAVYMTEDGITIIWKSEAGTEADSSKLSPLLRQATEDGQTYLKQLRDYLYANPDTYPLFKNSAAYSVNSSDVITNDTTNKIYLI